MEAATPFSSIHESFCNTETQKHLLQTQANLCGQIDLEIPGLEADGLS